MAGAGLVSIVILLAIVAPVVLYLLVRSEHDRREVMDRRSAERAARRDADEGVREADDEPRANGDEWGSEDGDSTAGRGGWK
ncbi:hypothetical protein ACFQAS_12520 [Halopenitus salinus]|uniref:Preprotein translocase subunit TatA n=1 Tax=Halopenitus salinus TaxID=1198295 RepID=A0ABD5USU7_9EURY